MHPTRIQIFPAHKHHKEKKLTKTSGNLPHENKNHAGPRSLPKTKERSTSNRGGSGDPGALRVLGSQSSTRLHHRSLASTARSYQSPSNSALARTLSPLVRRGSGVEDKRKSERRGNCCGALLGVECGGGVFVSLAFFFPVSPLEINGTCRECSKGGHAWAAIVCYGPGVRPLSSVSSL